MKSYIEKLLTCNYNTNDECYSSVAWSLMLESSVHTRPWNCILLNGSGRWINYLLLHISVQEARFQRGHFRIECFLGFKLQMYNRSPLTTFKIPLVLPPLNLTDMVRQRSNKVPEVHWHILGLTSPKRWRERSSVESWLNSSNVSHWATKLSPSQ